MTKAHTVVISDTHFGSEHFLRERFRGFLEGLPESVELVLNGDVVDKRHRRRIEECNEALALLRAESLKRKVIWVRGNHDRRFVMTDPGRIEFKPWHSIGDRIFMCHGHDFEAMRCYTRPFAFLFYLMYQTRLLLGAESVHVAFYAKRYPLLYRVLTNHVLRQAASFAVEKGYTAVVCGHTHFAQDEVRNGVRYLNTGAWTEEPVFCARINGSELKLEKLG